MSCSEKMLRYYSTTSGQHQQEQIVICFCRLAQGLSVRVQGRNVFEMKDNEGSHLHGLDLRVLNSSLGCGDVTGWIFT